MHYRAASLLPPERTNPVKYPFAAQSTGESPACAICAARASAHFHPVPQSARKALPPGRQLRRPYRDVAMQNAPPAESDPYSDHHTTRPPASKATWLAQAQLSPSHAHPTDLRRVAPEYLRGACYQTEDRPT